MPLAAWPLRPELIQQASEAGGDRYFLGQGALQARAVELLPEVNLGCRRSSGRALRQNEIALDAQQLGHQPAFVRRFAFAGVLWIAIVPTATALSSTIRARRTCFYGLCPDPTTALSLSRSPGPSRIWMPFLIQPDSHMARRLESFVRPIH